MPSGFSSWEGHLSREAEISRPPGGWGGNVLMVVKFHSSLEQPMNALATIDDQLWRRSTRISRRTIRIFRKALFRNAADVVNDQRCHSLARRHRRDSGCRQLLAVGAG